MIYLWGECFYRQRHIYYPLYILYIIFARQLSCLTRQMMSGDAACQCGVRVSRDDFNQIATVIMTCKACTNSSEIGLIPLLNMFFSRKKCGHIDCHKTQLWIINVFQTLLLYNGFNLEITNVRYAGRCHQERRRVSVKYNVLSQSLISWCINLTYYAVVAGGGLSQPRCFGTSWYCNIL